MRLVARTQAAKADIFVLDIRLHPLPPQHASATTVEESEAPCVDSMPSTSRVYRMKRKMAGMGTSFSAAKRRPSAAGTPLAQGSDDGEELAEHLRRVAPRLEALTQVLDRCRPSSPGANHTMACMEGRRGHGCARRNRGCGCAGAAMLASRRRGGRSDVARRPGSPVQWPTRPQSRQVLFCLRAAVRGQLLWALGARTSSCKRNGGPLAAPPCRYRPGRDLQQVGRGASATRPSCVWASG